MILKHRDKELLRFEWIEPQGVRIVSVNDFKERKRKMIKKLMMLCVAAMAATGGRADADVKVSDLKMGRVYCGEYVSHESNIWEGGNVQLYEDQYVFVPVVGNGTITPIIFYGSLPVSYLGALEIWNDEEMFSKFRLSDNVRITETLWPDRKANSLRRWIVVPVNRQTYWGPDFKFHIGIVGTDQISDTIRVAPGDGGYYAECKLKDFLHEFTIAGVNYFCAWDDYYWFTDGSIVGTEKFAFDTWTSAVMSFKVVLPAAGTLVIAGREDEDNVAEKEAISIGSNNGAIIYDMQDSFDDIPVYVRRVEISKATTLTFRSISSDSDAEFISMHFYPKDSRAVAIDVGYTSENGEIQGYVTGGGVYIEGEKITLNAVSAKGEEFSHWEVKEIPLSEVQKRSPKLSFEVSKDMCGMMDEEKRIFIRAVWKPKYSIVALPSICGAGMVTGSGAYYEGETVTLKATAATGCTFVRWSDGETSPTRTITVVPADVERVIFACFEAPNGVPNGNGGENSGGDAFLVIPDAASVYDGYVMNGDVVVGTMQAKVAKPKKGEAKVTVTVQITSEKKLSVKGEMNAATGAFIGETKDGRVLSLTFNMDEVKGAFGNYEISGVRNLFSSKDKAEKATADEMLAPWLGAMNMITGGGTLSVTIAKKGKVTVKGTIDGEKISAKAQALIGEDMICIPVIYSKKTVNLAFVIWLPLDGGEAEVVGLDGAVIGKAGTLKAGAKFYIDDAILSDIEGIVTYNGKPALPDGESVSQSKTKWVVADGVKAAKVAYKKGVLSIAEGKKGAGIANISGLKLTYKSKDGSFKGSFTVYAIENGKLKKHKASISGVLVNGIGYGTATIKKIGTWVIEIK